MSTIGRVQELRVALYSHDSLGLGHTRRNLAIAQSLADSLPGLTGRRVSGLLITGERTATSYCCPDGFDWVMVPGIRKSTGCYEPRTLAVGADRLFDIRSAVISGALSSFRPHLVIVDRHALGVDGELAGPLRELKRAKPDVTLVLGLREVLDDPGTARREWEAIGVDRVLELFDRIWVYGDRDVHDPIASGEVPEQFLPHLDFTGLLAAGRRTSGRTPAAAQPYVVTMLGGGADGGRTALAAAAAPLPEGLNHLVVTGPQMPAAMRAEVEAAAGPATRVTSRVADGLSYVRSAAALISMAGYNTIAETLSTATPALVIPRVQPRTEQLVRARALAATGALDCLHPNDASPAAIGDWLASVAASAAVRRRQAAARSRLDLGGLARVAELAADLARRTAAAPLPISLAAARPTGQNPARPASQLSRRASALLSGRIPAAASSPCASA
jgi:predicted glycosyltransferase